MRPLKKINRVPRRVIGWFIAGIALGAAVLTKGPIALVFVIVPLGGAIFISKHRRLGNSLGFFFALCLGLLIAGPWYMYVLDRIQTSVGSLTHEFAAQRRTSPARSRREFRGSPPDGMSRPFRPPGRSVGGGGRPRKSRVRPLQPQVKRRASTQRPTASRS